ncbi:MAG: DUF3440 domain-containing protein [Alphaproteobacteria bacterium]|nr:DUF3440 domain-containing protein [Alphaproteobacteria bacterium]
MKKIYMDKNVYDAAIERIKYCFDTFDNVLVAFSGGKDSGVMLNICYEYAKSAGLLNKMAMYHIDYEAQYEKTTEYVRETFDAMVGIRLYWLCLSMSAQCAVNMRNPGVWYPWDRREKDIWVREIPDHPAVLHQDNVPFKFIERTSDYEVLEMFGRWFASEYGSTAVLIGNRASESLNRFRSIVSNKKVNEFDGKPWIFQLDDKVTYKAYPIYDWSTQDVWVANAKFGYAYNKLYDIMYQSGVSVENMRVASPFNDCAVTSLKLYKVLEPNTWARLVGRVSGVNFAGIYGGTTAVGWRKIMLPKGYTWKQYCYFLLDTLDEKLRENYLRKLNTSINFWKTRGGALSRKTVEQLVKFNQPFSNMGKVSKTSEKDVIIFEEYPDDLGITDFKSVPTYKRMCVCILKNDYFCKYMGFAATSEETRRKKIAMEIYDSLCSNIAMYKETE